MGVLFSTFFASQGNAFETENFPINLNPAQVVKLMEKTTSSIGSESESAAVLLENNGKFVSVATNPNQKSIVPESEILKLINKVEDISKTDIHNKEIWLIHNHPVKVIEKYWSGYSINQIKFTNPNSLLNGPSLGDCKRFKSIEGFWKNKKISILNIIKEPGGLWFCSGDFKLPLPEHTFDTFEKLREDLVIASQKLNGKELESAIQKFENQTFILLGIKIKFLKNESRMADFNKVKD